MKRIKLTQGKFALVDDADFEWLNQWKWRVNAQGYAVRREYTRISKGVRHAVDFRMHRQIMGEPQGMEVDHEDGEGLNNQRYNLRVATHQQNLANRPKQKNNTSGYKGVSWSKQNKKWWAHICVSGKTISIGHYKDIKEAAKAYNEAASIHQGSFARLNLL